MPATPERIRKIRAELRARGICTRCHKRPAGEGRLICKPCVSATTANKAVLREKWKAKGGNCVSCGVAITGGIFKCRRCNQYAVKWLRRKRKEWRAKGLCYGCGRPIPNGPGLYATCPHCAERHRRDQFMRRLRGSHRP